MQTVWHKAGQWGLALLVLAVALGCQGQSMKRFNVVVTADKSISNRTVEIDLVGVEFRTIYTGEFHFSIYKNTAASTHTGPIDHNGIQADNGLDIKRAGNFSHFFHHQRRPDRKHSLYPIGLRIFLNQFC